MDQEQLRALTEKAKRSLVGLDDLVHDVASRQASQVNNDGAEAQVRYLVEHLGLEQAAKVVNDLPGSQ